jgi:hypothetical protein
MVCLILKSNLNVVTLNKWGDASAPANGKEDQI